MKLNDIISTNEDITTGISMSPLEEQENTLAISEIKSDIVTSENKLTGILDASESASDSIDTLTEAIDTLKSSDSDSLSQAPVMEALIDNIHTSLGLPRSEYTSESFKDKSRVEVIATLESVLSKIADGLKSIVKTLIDSTIEFLSNIFTFTSFIRKKLLSIKEKIKSQEKLPDKKITIKFKDIDDFMDRVKKQSTDLKESDIAVTNYMNFLDDYNKFNNLSKEEIAKAEGDIYKHTENFYDSIRDPDDRPKEPMTDTSEVQSEIPNLSKEVALGFCDVLIKLLDKVDAQKKLPRSLNEIKIRMIAYLRLQSGMWPKDEVEKAKATFGHRIRELRKLVNNVIRYAYKNTLRFIKDGIHLLQQTI